MPGGGRRLVLAAVTMVLVAGGCGSSEGKGAAGSTAPTPATTVGPLVGPSTDAAKDTTYLSDLAAADPQLADYATSRGTTALRALLTDGAGFCAFLSRYGDVDRAMTSLAVGARSVESTSHLPLSVTTFNAIDAVALLTLCPGDLRLLPAAARARIALLGSSLAGRSAQAG